MSNTMGCMGNIFTIGDFMMKIYDLASHFLNSYHPTSNYYEKYFNKYSDVFNYYFENHCLNKDLKLEKALIQHPKMIQEMTWITQKIVSITPKITTEYEKHYPIKFTKDVYIIVGLGGSNAYTYRSMDPHVTFCVEKLEAEEDALKVIIAHEFGHATHHLFTTYNGINASNIPWSSPLTWLLQEGVATYLSTQVVKVEQDIYFAYKRDIEWLKFCEENKTKVITAFKNDLIQNSSREIFKEWFSINGGQKFNYTRIGYYIGYVLVHHLTNEQGIENAMLLWGHSDFKKQMNNLIDSFL